MHVGAVKNIETLLAQYLLTPTDTLKKQLAERLFRFDTKEVPTTLAYREAVCRIFMEKGTMNDPEIFKLNFDEKVRIFQIALDEKIAELPDVLSRYKFKLAEQIAVIQQTFASELASIKDNCTSDIRTYYQWKVDSVVGKSKLTLSKFKKKVEKNAYFKSDPTNFFWVKLLQEIDEFFTAMQLCLTTDCF
jgi:hypothetical protein